MVDYEPPCRPSWRPSLRAAPDGRRGRRTRSDRGAAERRAASGTGAGAIATSPSDPAACRSGTLCMGSRSVSKSRSLYRSLESICKSLVLRSTHDSIDRRELYSPQ